MDRIQGRTARQKKKNGIFPLVPNLIIMTNIVINFILLTIATTKKTIHKKTTN